MRRFFELALVAAVVLASACGADAPAGRAATAAVDSASSEPQPQRVEDAAVASGGAQSAPDSMQPPATAVALPAQLTAVDSLRTDIARLTATVNALAVSHDTLLAALRSVDEAATGPGPLSGQDLFDEAGATVRNYGARSFWALIVLVLTALAVRTVVTILNTLSERSATRRLLFKRLVPIARILLWSVAVYFTVRVVFDVDARGLLAAAAALGVAIGFAAQDILKNIFGGLVIVFDQPFQVGDKIQVGDSYGEVVSIGLRSTRIVTPADSLVSVPNAQVVDSQVSNANSGALDCQVVVDLYLPGWVDEARAKAIASQAAASSKYVYLAKPIVVLVRDEFRETFITHLKVKAYVMDARHEFAFMSDITERARAEFRRAGLLRPMHGMRAWVDLSSAAAMADGPAAPGDGPT